MSEQTSPGRFKLPRTVVDSRQPIALYVQVANVLRFNIQSGAWPQGYRLPNFDVLADRFKVARVTVRQAVALLVAEKLLSSARGRGTVVEPIARAGAPSGPPSVFPADHAGEAIQIRIRYRDDAAALPAEFRGEYGAFERYVELAKSHGYGDEPFAVMRIFAAGPLFDQLAPEALVREKIFTLVMAQTGPGAFLEQTMTVEPADLVLSEQLGCALGAPVAKILRRLVGRDGRLCYAGISWYRGDQFVLSMVFPKAEVERMPHSTFAPRRKTPGPAPSNPAA